MKAYLVSVDPARVPAAGLAALTSSVFVGSMAEAREARRTMIDTFGLKFKDVDVTDVEIPTSKTELLAWINDNI